MSGREVQLDPKERFTVVANHGKALREQIDAGRWKDAKATAHFMRVILGQVVTGCDQQLEKERK